MLIPVFHCGTCAWAGEGKSGVGLAIPSPLDGCLDQARTLVEDAWLALNPLVEESLAKVMLRAFGWYVLERHY